MISIALTEASMEERERYHFILLRVWTLQCGDTTRGSDIYLHTYLSRFIPEGVAEASQTFLRDAHVLPKLVNYEDNYIII
jgi:hypothetical protein